MREQSLISILTIKSTPREISIGSETPGLTNTAAARDLIADTSLAEPLKRMKLTR